MKITRKVTVVLVALVTLSLCLVTGAVAQTEPLGGQPVPGAIKRARDNGC
jgi:hypothetical protein